ncbi:MAG: butyrate kinase [Candidatus Marinimicrobia bacterium]|nr:butyrate kinase [Candidatus Neomarinimicrobiota bacterium]
MSEVVIVINPGSSSTKLAVYSRQGEIFKLQFPGSPPTVPGFQKLLDSYLTDSKVLTIVSRGGLLKPLIGGVYGINEAMLGDLRQEKYGRHASNLGAVLAWELGNIYEVPSYVVDPVTTDEFESLARISGVPGIERVCRGHILNIKAVARKACSELELDFETTRFVVAHLGGGISVAALKKGRIIDVNDALMGMGPFSPQRAGALPLRAILDLAYSSPREKVEYQLSKTSGLKGYLDTDDMITIERRIIGGDNKTKLIVDAMIYQIAKEIGAMFTVLSGRINGIIITGGLAYSDYLVNVLRTRLEGLGKLLVYSGEFEMEALAQGAWRVLQGEETVREYA